MPPTRIAPIRPLEALWRDFAFHTLPSQASETQRIETRRAFYAGARALFTALQRGVSGEEEVTAQDMHLMDDIYEDLPRFARDLARGMA